MLETREERPEVAGAECRSQHDGEELEQGDRQPPVVYDPSKRLVARRRERTGTAQLEPGSSVSPQDLHLCEGEASKPRRQRLSHEGDHRNRDPGRDSGDEHSRGRVPAPPVGSADSKPERAGDHGLNDDPNPPDEKRDRAGSENRDHSRPCSLPGCERRERNDCQALKGRADDGHEPPEYLEDEP